MNLPQRSHFSIKLVKIMTMVNLRENGRIIITSMGYRKAQSVLEEAITLQVELS